MSAVPVDIPVKRLRNGFEMPVFGIGTSRMGGGRMRDRTKDYAAAVRAIRAALEHGVTHVDTAEGYGDGQAERIVAQAIRGFDRARLFIVSKVSRSHLRYDEVLRAAEGSLERLEVDYLDLYLVHAPNPGVPLEETMRAMDELVDRGVVRDIGVSNFAVETLAEARAKAENPIVANQVHYNLVYREPERSGLLRYCQEEDVMLVAWRAIELGTLANEPPRLLRRVAEKYGCTPGQVAINWLVVQPNVTALAKSSSLTHLEENLGALGWELEPGHVELLRRDFPGQRGTSAVPLG